MRVCTLLYNSRNTYYTRIYLFRVVYDASSQISIFKRKTKPTEKVPRCRLII